ncbi:type IV pilus biogenesis/stability protein PilW [Legionella fairfieldensis]|uniref:type IV pilus biogenesis/stability protein PilW n=1 Tax=Legionella fairfieldensis TaxID=45064 RepID=UPI00048B463E|nr:type IV pilus biogenesis/stability protein PilW [Legionella fairfieldensis]
MLNLIRLLLFFSFIVLQACQQRAQNTENTQKLKEAASYNTQLGIAYLKQGDSVRAKHKLLTALDLAPDSPDVNVAMAYYFEKTGDTKEARTYYQKALSLAPGSGAQLNNYGTFLCRLGEYKEAESYFLKAVKDVHYIYTAGAYENAGLCAAAIPDYPKAKYYFSKALNQDPQRKQSLYELVKIELGQHHAVKALFYLQRYPELTLEDLSLLSLAIKVAHTANKPDAESVYKQRLSQLNPFTDYTGAKHEYNNNNG